MRIPAIRIMTLLLVAVLLVSACATPEPTVVVTPMPTNTTTTAGAAATTTGGGAAQSTEAAVFAKPAYTAMIDVGAYKLAVQCWGSGSPTVILDADLGVALDVWQAIIPEVGGKTRVCAYNRAGVGNSERSPMMPRTVTAFADEMYRMLDAAKITPPYVLVSSGVAALAARLNYRDHADALAGIVFVEPSSPSAKADMQPLIPAEAAGDNATVKAWRQLYNDTNWFSWPEALNLDSSITQASKVTSLGSIPLTIVWPSAATIDSYVAGLPADNATKIKAAFDKWQKETAQLSTKSTVIVSTQTGGSLAQKDPQLVTKAILDMFQLVKTK
jgi:pimeloyl-ACP methyl ester carboxylesterase